MMKAATPNAKQRALSSTAAVGLPNAKEPPASPLPDWARDLQLIDFEGLAAIIGCTARHAQNIYLSGHIRPVAGIGRLVRFSPAEVARFTNCVLSGEIVVNVGDQATKAAPA
jgi:hypothetical protein